MPILKELVRLITKLKAHSPLETHRDNAKCKCKGRP
jgi:hypothetical protein